MACYLLKCLNIFICFRDIYRFILIFTVVWYLILTFIFSIEMPQKKAHARKKPPFNKRSQQSSQLLQTLKPRTVRRSHKSQRHNSELNRSRKKWLQSKLKNRPQDSPRSSKTRSLKRRKKLLLLPAIEKLESMLMLLRMSRLILMIFEERETEK